MFSIDAESGFRGAVLVSAAWGLGESVVQGTVNPDEFLVLKPTLRQGFRPILQRRPGSKELKLVYDEGGTRQTRSVPVPPPGSARTPSGRPGLRRVKEVESHITLGAMELAAF